MTQESGPKILLNLLKAGAEGMAPVMASHTLWAMSSVADRFVSWPLHAIVQLWLRPGRLVMPRKMQPWTWTIAIVTCERKLRERLTP